MIHNNKDLKILQLFLSDFNRMVYGRELVKKVDLGQKNIALTLDEMEKKNILKFEFRGKQKLYFLNKKNPLIRLHLIKTEIERTLCFLEKYPLIKNAVVEINSNGITCIFGSYTTGTQKEKSDLDIFVIGKAELPEIRKVGEKYDIEISPKIMSRRDFVHGLRKKEPLLAEVMKNHVIISGFEDFVNIAWGDFYGNQY